MMMGMVLVMVLDDSNGVGFGCDGTGSDAETNSNNFVVKKI